MSCKEEPNIAAILKNISHQLDTENIVRVNTLLSRKFTYEFTLGSQDENKALNLTLSLGDYIIRSENKENTLILDLDAYIDIDPNEIFSYIPEFLRREYIHNVSVHNSTIYKPESASISSNNNAISGSVDKVAVLDMRSPTPERRFALSIRDLHPVVEIITLSGGVIQKDFSIYKKGISGSSYIYITVFLTTN